MKYSDKYNKEYVWEIISFYDWYKYSLINIECWIPIAE